MKQGRELWNLHVEQNQKLEYRQSRFQNNHRVLPKFLDPKVERNFDRILWKDPYHFPEKLIPKTILNALNQVEIPVYGNGKQVRDWLYVEDHVDALYTILKNGKLGETYNIGGNNEKSNIEVVNKICSLLDERSPRKKGIYSDLISFVEDRPGHDFRYAIDSSKLKEELNWKPIESFETGLTKTVEWYLANDSWLSKVTV